MKKKKNLNLTNEKQFELVTLSQEQEFYSQLVLGV
jgi:hypothetical protein